MNPDELQAAADEARKIAELKADDVIKNHVIVAMAAGFIPLPLIVDMVAVTGIEIHMITGLAKAYSYPVPQKLVLYKVMVSLIGGVGPAYLAAKFDHVIKGLPLIGTAIYLGGLSISGGASVYAVGKLFERHFQSGGMFLSSDNSVVRRYFKEKREEGITRVPAMLAEASKANI